METEIKYLLLCTEIFKILDIKVLVSKIQIITNHLNQIQMKKLESIKLEKFKENELPKLDKIGGETRPGTYREGATVYMSYLLGQNDRDWDISPDGGGISTN